MSLRTSVTVAKVSGFTAMLLYLLFLLATFGAALLLGVWWLFWLVRFGIDRARKPAAPSPSGKILARSSVLAALLGVFIWLVFLPPAMLIYHSRFGEFPAADITGLRAKSSFGFDGEEAFLRFQSSPETVEHLVNVRHLTPISLESFGHFGLGETPSWWQPQPNAASLIYELHTTKGTGGKTEDLIYDPQSRTVYYGFSSVD